MDNHKSPGSIISDTCIHRNHIKEGKNVLQNDDLLDELTLLQYQKPSEIL